MTWPPPFGSRGSDGALTLYSVYSDRPTTRLSVTVKPLNVRRA
jgi:hypothetical protein